MSLFALDFGRSDRRAAVDIGHEIKHAHVARACSSRVPLFLLQVIVSMAFALLLVFFRHSRIDFWGVVLCVVMLSISSLFYIIVGQFLFSRVLHLVPISGYAAGLDAVRFLLLPVVLSLLSRLGTEARLYRAMFLEEIGKDYVRTARAKGLTEAWCCSATCCSNALIPILTGAGCVPALLFLGSLVFESFFGIPGLGTYVIEAIRRQDFAIVRAMVFLGSVLYIAGYIADRHRLHLGRPAGAAGLTRTSACLKLVVLGPTWSLWAMLLRCSPMRLARARQRQPARHLAQGAARPGGAAARRVVLALFVARGGARRVHFRRALATAAGAGGRRQAFYATRTESLLDLVLARQVATRETTYSAPLATHAFTKETIERDGAVGARLPAAEVRRRAPDATRTRSGPATCCSARARRPGGGLRGWRCCCSPRWRWLRARARRHSARRWRDDRRATAPTCRCAPRC